LLEPWKGQNAIVVGYVGESSMPTEVTPKVSGGGEGGTVEGYGGEGYVCGAACETDLVLDRRTSGRYEGWFEAFEGEYGAYVCNT
jgi:hypothetical protein